MDNDSKTMFIIGRQYTNHYITPEVMQQLQEILKADITTFGLWTAIIDAFIWGHISGTRSERKRRRDRK